MDRSSVLQACPDAAEQKAIDEQESKNLDRETPSYMHKSKNPMNSDRLSYSINQYDLPRRFLASQTTTEGQRAYGLCATGSNTPDVLDRRRRSSY